MMDLSNEHCPTSASMHKFTLHISQDINRKYRIYVLGLLRLYPKAHSSKVHHKYDLQFLLYGLLDLIRSAAATKRIRVLLYNFAGFLGAT
jgi:hypothetical protein